MPAGIKFELNNRLYLRDPQETSLGKNIIRASIDLINQLGFEDFTFKKLAQEIESTEASVYRYFENKHLLLIYLVSWYWEWVHFLIDINLMNISDPKEQLKVAIKNIVNATRENKAIDYVNEEILHQIVISEGAKAYHTKLVDKENKEGLFVCYKSVAERVMEIILDLNPKFPYPRALASNLFESANNQIYFAQHLPRLTDIKDKKTIYDDLEKMLVFFAFQAIGLPSEK